MRLLIRAFVALIVVIVLLAVLRQISCGPMLDHVGADFRVDRDGYAYDNPSDVTTGNDRDVWQSVFGDDEGSRKNYDDQTAAGANLFGGGLCYGMSGSSLNIFGGWAKASDFAQDPAAENTHGVRADMTGGDFDTAPSTVRDYIERYQIAQFTQGVKDAAVWQAPAAYAIMREALRRGGRDMAILRVRTRSQHKGKPAGHAVVPIAIDGPDDKGGVSISLWDNNTHDRVRKMKLNTTTWEWSYRVFQFETWSSKDGYFGVSRISDVVAAMDASPGGSGVKAKSGGAAPGGASAMVPLTVVSGADAVFRGPDGGSLSYVRGRLRDDLPGAEFVYPGVLGEASSSTSFIVPLGGGIRRTATARTAAPYRYAVLTSLGSAVITGRPGRRKTDALEVGSGAASVSLTPGAGEPDCRVSLARFVDDQARVMTVMPSDLGSAETLTVAATDQNQAVRVVNEGRARTYRVVLSSYGEIGSFTSGPLAIGAGETQTVKAYDWGDIRASQVELFRGTAGVTGATGGTILREGSRSSGPFPRFAMWIALGALAAVIAVVAVTLRLRNRRPI